MSRTRSTSAGGVASRLSLATCFAARSEICDASLNIALNLRFPNRLRSMTESSSSERIVIT